MGAKIDFKVNARKVHEPRLPYLPRAAPGTGRGSSLPLARLCSLGRWPTPTLKWRAIITGLPTHPFLLPSCSKGSSGLHKFSQDTWNIQLAPSPAKFSVTAVGVGIGLECLTPEGSFPLPSKPIHGQEPVSPTPALGLPGVGGVGGWGGQKVLQDCRRTS